MPIKLLTKEEILHDELGGFASMNYNLLDNYLRTLVTENFKFSRQGNTNISSFLYGDLYKDHLVIVSCYDETENKNKIKDINPHVLLKFIYRRNLVKELKLSDYGLKVHYERRRVNIGDYLVLDMNNKDIYVKEIFGEKCSFEKFEEDFKSAVMDSLLS